MQVFVTQIRLLRLEKRVELHFDNHQVFQLSCEYLRVFSPSVEVRGYGGVGGSLVLEKEMVNIIEIEPVGHYAVRFVFDDGHATGIYSWDTLYNLAIHQKEYWENYLARVRTVKN